MKLNILYKSFRKVCSLIKSYRRQLSKWESILWVMIFSLIVLKVSNYVLEHYERIEGFEGDALMNTFTHNDTPETIYDSFYASIYDQLVFNDERYQFEIDEIVTLTKPNKKSMILDVGCGTGNHVYGFQHIGHNVIGIDKSKEMIEFAKKNYPKHKFKQGDVLETMTFEEDSLTHVLCLYFTVYYIKDKRTFFQNVYQWLKPGGYFVIHLVNRNKFDPLLPPANPMHFVSLQKHAKKRIMDTNITFNNYEYKAKFKMNNDESKFIEEFKTKKGKTFRKNEHTFYMETQKDILGTAKDCGFILHAKSDMVSCQYEYQYMYVLKKST